MAEEKTSTRRSAAERTKHRQIIAERITQGFTQDEIAEELGIGRSLVAYDVKILKEEWQKQSMTSLEDHKRSQLRKLDLLEKETWKLYFRSQKDEVTVSDKSTKDYKQKGALGGGAPGGEEELESGDIKKVSPTEVQQNEKVYSAKQVKKKIGNARMLELILKINAERNSLLGLSKVTIKHDLNVEGMEEQINNMSDTELNEFIYKMVADMGVGEARVIDIPSEDVTSKK